MKKTFKQFLPVIFLLGFLSSYSQEDTREKRERYEHFKERNISKTYPASGNTLNIDNRFGEVKINTWNRNEIKVDIHIETSSNDKDYAEKSFERIDVKDRKEGSNIYFKTEMGGEKGEKLSCKNCKNTMSIDYEVHMPASNALNVENSFGSIEVPDYSGPVSLVSKFGSLTAGKLSKPKKVSVEFGHANLKELSDVDLEFKYSSVSIDKLTGKCALELSFCSYSKFNLDNSLTSLTVNNSYSSVHLNPATGLSATYTVNTSFGNLIDNSNIDFKRTDTPSKYGGDMKKSYEGKSGSGATKISVKSSFGNIMIGPGTQEDMKSKRKVKS